MAIPEKIQESIIFKNRKFHCSAHIEISVLPVVGQTSGYFPFLLRGVTDAVPLLCSFAAIMISGGRELA